MDKQRLLRLRKLNKEAEDLRERIKKFEFKPREPVIDISASDYRTGRPRPIVNEGIGDNDYIKAKDRIHNQYVRKLIEIQKEIEEIEAFLSSVKDPELRTILRLYYINGFTQDEIANELGYSRETIKRRLKAL